MKIEVVYARPDAMKAVNVNLSPGATVRDAVLASGLLGAETDLEKKAFGVFGKRAPLDRRLADGDRVEIYRPLAMDPKEARRRRARARR